jgi:hypothetical protein
MKLPIFRIIFNKYRIRTSIGLLKFINKIIMIFLNLSEEILGSAFK